MKTLLNKPIKIAVLLLFFLNTCAVAGGEQDSSYPGNTDQESIDSDPSEVEPSLLEGKAQLPKFNLFSELKKTCSKNEKVAEIIEFLPDISALFRYTFRWRRDKDFAQVDNKINRIFVWVDKEFLDDKFGYHFDFRYQQRKLGKYPREAWMEEGYGYVNTPIGKVKVGSVHNPFGLLWDHTFYGSTIYYKGYMLDADYGVVIENTNTVNERITLNSAFGYALRSDGLNGATAFGNGIELLDGGEKNTFTGRINPVITISDNASLALGGSMLIGGIRHPELKQQVALEADAVFCWGPMTLTTEYVYYDQNYRHKDVTAWGHLFLAEADLKVYKNTEASFFRGVTLKYNYSKDTPEGGTGLGTIHLPAIFVELTDFFQMELNYVHWESGKSTFEESWWLITYLSF